MTKRPNPYEELAAYLAPNDPEEGEQQIDTAILAYERARFRPYNRNLAVCWISRLLLLISGTVLGTSLICWMVPAMESTFYGGLADAIPLWMAKIVFVVTFLHLVYRGTFWVNRQHEPRPLLPESIAWWLIAHGKTDLRYWAELYWPDRKRRANRTEVLGFVFWRRMPCRPDRYPPAPVQTEPNPHLIYLESPQGRTDEAAYLIAFEHRMDVWWRLSFRVTIGLLIVLMIASWLPIFPPNMAGQFIRIGIILAFMAGCALLFFGGSVPMRWLPYPFRRFWFRELPPEAAHFRDHMIGLYH